MKYASVLTMTHQLITLNLKTAQHTLLNNDPHDPKRYMTWALREYIAVQLRNIYIVIRVVILCFDGKFPLNVICQVPPGPSITKREKRTSFIVLVIL